MKTKRVRIAVAITPDGKWNCCGWDYGKDDEMMSTAVDCLPAGEARYWIEADLPVPEVSVIAGEVTPA